jgi:hypothetical protein
VITAIGITSIVIGSVTMIWGAFAAFMTFGLFLAATGWSAMTAATTPDMTGPKGHSPGDRTVIVQALSLKQNLSQAQKDQLEWFLADVGTLYLPNLPAPTAGSDAAVDYRDANITESSTDVEGGAAHYEIPMGKLTVTDTAVSIALKDGNTITRSRARQMPNPADPSQLSPQEIGALVSRAQELSFGTPMSAAQLAMLTTEIQNNSATLVGSPKDMPQLLSQVSSVTNNGGGNTYVYFHDGVVSLPATGAATTSTFGVSSTTNTGPNMLPTPSVMLIIEKVLSVGLAIYLLVIGIVTLRSSPSGAKLHKIYAWLKIVLTLVGTGALAWLIVGGGGTPAWATLWGFMMLLVGVLYPIILLSVLRMKSVRDWYTVEHIAA